jgi:EmrB/QacA subfamily drug resistance transporter
MLTGAALGERFGRRRVFTAGLLVFTLASAAGALAPSTSALILARVVQGAGAAVLMPLGVTLLTAAFPAERRGVALGIWSAISGIGVALGPITGGLLTAALSWHWIFWVNVPVGLVAAALSPRLLAESRGAPEPLDVRGLALAAAGLFGIVFATVRGNSVGWGAPMTLIGYGTGVALLVAFLRWEARAAHPMLPLRIFRDRAFTSANAAGFLLHFAMFGTFFFLIQFLALVRGEGSIAEGVSTLPWTLMPLLVSPLAGRAGKRIEPARLTAAGMTLVSAGIISLALLVGPSTSALALAPSMFVTGVGIGIVLPNVVALAMGSVAAADIGRASGTLSTARQLGSVFGVAVPAAVFQLASSSAGVADVSTGIMAALYVAGLAAVGGVLVTARKAWVLPRRLAVVASEG